jgi:nitroimidazol reductase NimA-like FMN-containing flavoprotein (pyridoxamine 5'-phosphate oxidase superfamily)
MPDERLEVDGPRVTEPPPRAIVPLNDAQCREVLARQRMCVVSVVDGDEPYAVPVFYGFDGEDLYLGVAEGRKTRALDANSRVHIVVTEVGPGDAWRSVAIAGCARTLTESGERQRAVDVLIAHNRRLRAPDPERATPPRRPAGGRVLRIEQSLVTGRAFG